MTQALTVYRRSQLEDADCLFRWDQIWNRGVDDSSDFSLRGQAFAHIKYLYISRLLEKHVEADDEEAQAAFVQGIAEHQTPQRLIPELRELWMRHAEVFTLDLTRYVGHEERQEGDGLSFSPDLVYANPDELEIVDDKTFWVMLTDTEARQSFQGRFYAAQARKRWPNFPRYRFTFFFVRFNKVVSVVYAQGELDQIETEIQAAVARIEQARAMQMWPAVAGPSCRYCELKCPLADVEVRMPIRLTHEQAPRVGAWVLVVEKALKAGKKVLKAYAAANGPVLVGDVEFANRPMQSRSYPIDAVLETLRKRNALGAFDASAEMGLTISHSALKSLFKQFPLIEKDLAPFVSEKTSFRFSAQRPGGDDKDDDA